MNAALRKSMTLPEFLAWEHSQPRRFEFDAVQPVATTGATVAHNRIMRRLHRALERGLEDQPCEPSGPDLKIVIDGRVNDQA